MVAELLLVDGVSGKGCEEGGGDDGDGNGGHRGQDGAESLCMSPGDRSAHVTRQVVVETAALFVAAESSSAQRAKIRHESRALDR